MADILHSTLTGADLHECKGAATAAIGQVPVATGSGTAVFGALDYSFISGKPVIPTVLFNGLAIAGTPVIRHYIVTAVAGSWSQGISGLTTLHGVQATVVSTTPGETNAYVATINSATTATITGQVVKISGPALGTTQTVYLTVYGV